MVNFSSMFLAAVSAHPGLVDHANHYDPVVPSLPYVPQQMPVAPQQQMGMGMDPMMMMMLMMGDDTAGIKSRAEYDLMCASAGANAAACSAQVDIMYNPIGVLNEDCGLVVESAAKDLCLAQHQTTHAIISGFSTLGGSGGLLGGDNNMLMMMMMMGGMGGGAGGMGGMLPLLLMGDGLGSGSGGMDMKTMMLMMMMNGGGMGGDMSGGMGMGGMNPMMMYLLMK